MKSVRPSLWQCEPRTSLRLRLKCAGLALVVALLLVPLITWAQSATAPTPAAPAATAPATASLPPYFGADPASAEFTKQFPDPTGGNIGTWSTPSGVPNADGSIAGDNPATLTTSQLYDRILHNQYAINIMWTLLCGFLVMFMQFGFALVETGLIRAKNAGHTFAMNLVIYPLGCIAFYIYGFALGWGNFNGGPVAPGWYASLGPGLYHLNSGLTLGGWNLLGLKGFCLSGCSDVSILAYFFFMMVFMDTTATIPTGAMAERWTWGNFCLFGLWVALPYCIFANWVWGGGWLAQLGTKLALGHGMVDFAGSGVVHAMGGAIGLAGAIIIGPRIGKFINGKPQAIPGHHLPMVMGGTFVLAFGWFGFNPGSTLSGTDLRVSFVVVNTMLAGIAGAISAMCIMWYKFGKPDPSMICNGMLAGLVAITAPCAFVSPAAAVLIGGVAGVLVVFGVFFWDKMGVDDPVGAVSVHGLNGTWGVLSLGLFANGEYGAGWNGVAGPVRGLFYGDAGQLGAQAIGAATVWIFGFSMAYVWFKLSNRLVPIRVTREVELQGLDIPEMGALGYPDFELKTTASIPEMSVPHGNGNGNGNGTEVVRSTKHPASSGI